MSPWRKCSEQLPYHEQEELLEHDLLLGQWDGTCWRHLWQGTVRRIERDARNLEFDELVLTSRAEWQEWPPTRIVPTHYMLLGDLPDP